MLSACVLRFSQNLPVGLGILALTFLQLSGCSEGNAAMPAATGGLVASGGNTGTGSTGSGGLPSSGGSGGSNGMTPSATFRVQGAKLQDRCGEEVVLRGVNEMVVWSPGRDGDPEFSEIAKTGANVVRIVWNDEGTASELDTAIQNALNQKLIPMVEHHGATGDLSLVPTVVDYWVQPDVLAVLKKHERDLLLNIANEPGNGSVTAQTFQPVMETAIARLREAGLVLPLILDAPNWGQNIDVLQATWQALTNGDPERNLVFSVHMWWHDETGARVTSELAESSAASMPLIVGEFAQHAVYQCAAAPFAYKTLMSEAERLGIGWLAWSWGSVPNNDCKDDGSFDMTVGGVYGSWTETWGEEVAVTDPNSIQNTSKRPFSIVNGTCQ